MGIRRLLGRVLRSPAQLDPADLAKDQEILRAAFRAGTWLEASPPIAPIREDEAPVAGPALTSRTTWRPTQASRQIASGAAPAARGSSPMPEPALAADRSAPQQPRHDGDTAPESLLRAPTSVTSVADDFFDGLVRRVEGDH